MLGTIICHQSESVGVKEGDNFVDIGGKRVEVKLEKGNQLRMSLLKTVNDREKQRTEAIAEFNNVLWQRHKDLALVKKELNDIIDKLNDVTLDADAEEELEKQARAKRAQKREYAQEISNLEAKTTVSVNYRIIKTGLTALLFPGMTLHPKFLPEPVCWSPYNVPESDIVEETTAKTEDIQLYSTSATGSGLKYTIPNEESRFVITAEDFKGDDTLAIESKEAEITSSVEDKKNGSYEVIYSASNITSGERFSLDVTLHGNPIHGSPFSVRTPSLLLEFSTAGNQSKDWLDPAIQVMTAIPRARLWVQLSDMNGSVAYKSTGVTNCKWTSNHITAPDQQWCDDQHTNAVQLDNGDRMLIIGKSGWSGGWGADAYRTSNIIINAGWDNDKLSYFNHPRRMIIAVEAPFVPGWSAPDNLISFSDSGFNLTENGNWPKFNGIFRIYFEPL